MIGSGDIQISKQNTKRQLLLFGILETSVVLKCFKVLSHGSFCLVFLGGSGGLGIKPITLHLAIPAPRLSLSFNQLTSSKVKNSLA